MAAHRRLNSYRLWCVGAGMDRRSTVQVNKERLMAALKSSGAGEEDSVAAEKQDWDSVINEELAAVGQVRGPTKM